jgi:two-component system, chemotaxis family, protein-glutamate methylesterase/glutaminase
VRWLETCNLAPAAPAIVAIGVSTGGPKALEQILPLFPTNFPIPIRIVQHMPIGFTTPFAERLNYLSSIKVKEAAQGELLLPGTAYVAPAGLHMRVVPRLSDSKTAAIRLDKDPADAPLIPSVDIMMTSVAQVFRNRVIGVIMTGMGSDGSDGMSDLSARAALPLGKMKPVAPCMACPASALNSAFWRRCCHCRISPLKSFLPPDSADAHSVTVT